ncbi:hypothetical protein PRK78_002557 [Emydomyces testavorans]|uniref:Uncharacterized protein n=1 Tax=Emydomyces testavorans TaxID=2070801 RepID=A0AAF0DGK6_9EURO|nr:hypothetical protein PRK78_002557 [Emydomyces testavorans]
MVGGSTRKPRPGYSASIPRRATRRITLREQLSRQTSRANESPNADRQEQGTFRPPASFSSLFEEEALDHANKKDEDTHESTQTKDSLESLRESYSSSMNTPLNRHNFIPTKGGLSGSLSFSSSGNTRDSEYHQSSHNTPQPEVHAKSQAGFPEGQYTRPLQAPLTLPAQSPLGSPANDIFAQFKSSSSHRTAPKDRSYITGLRPVKKAGEYLTRFLARYPDHKLANKEFEEYERCRNKLNENLSLSYAEKKRMNDISRNVERREYAIEKAAAEIRGEMQHIEALATNAKRNGPSLSSKEHVVENCARAKTAIEKGTTAESVGEYQKATSESSSDMEEESEDSEETEQQPVWRYHVYMEDTATTEVEPVLLSTYLSKSRAEARVSREIANAFVSGTLEDLTGVEMRCRFKDGDVCGQTLEFASGRAVQVQIERELIEEESLPKKVRKKLEYLPSKIFIVSEEFVPLEPSSPNDSYAPLPRHTHGKEGFILRRHANEQANRLMMAHLTNHLPEDKKFDFSITGNMDTEARLYLHELEQGERLYDNTKVVIDEHGRTVRVSIRVMEILVRGPRN